MKQKFKRFMPLSQNSFFLFGPRGTGKTIWIKQQKFSHSIYVDLNDEKMFKTYSTHTDYLKERIFAELKAIDRSNELVVVIDEIQKVTALLDTIHTLIVEYPGMQFILTGSSTRKIKRQDVNLLGGRATIRQMHPFMAGELGAHFNLKKALAQGMLPLVWGAKSTQDALEGYIGTYLKEEVKNEGIVRRIGSFALFLEVASFSHGTVANMTSIARECGVSSVTIHTYFEILEDLLLSFWVPVFTKRAQRALASKSKFYYFDAGIYRSLRPKGPIDATSEIEGLCLEGLVAQHLKAWCDYSQGQHKLYYWQTKSKAEVDFVVYGEKSFAAIEVKNTDRIRKEDLRHLELFRQDYPEAKLLFLYRGQDRLKKGNVLCLPCEDFLKLLTPNYWPFDSQVLLGS